MNADLTSRLHVPGPSSRYILPQFEERTSYGMKRLDPYTKLFEDRIIFLGVQVDDASADDVIAQLIVLESQDPDRDILMYINSPGGSFTAMTAIYDTMQYIRPDVQTFVIGQAASAAAVLLGAGAKGKRFALPNSRVLIHQPAIEGTGGMASDLEIHANEIIRMRGWLEETIAKHSEPRRRAGPQGHRARQDPLGRGGQGVRPHRRGARLAQEHRLSRPRPQRMPSAHPRAGGIRASASRDRWRSERPPVGPVALTADRGDAPGARGLQWMRPTVPTGSVWFVVFSRGKVHPWHAWERPATC